MYLQGQFREILCRSRPFVANLLTDPPFPPYNPPVQQGAVLPRSTRCAGTAFLLCPADEILSRVLTPRASTALRSSRRRASADFEAAERAFPRGSRLPGTPEAAGEAPGTPAGPVNGSLQGCFCGAAPRGLRVPSRWGRPRPGDVGAGAGVARAVPPELARARDGRGGARSHVAGGKAREAARPADAMRARWRTSSARGDRPPARGERARRRGPSSCSCWQHAGPLGIGEAHARGRRGASSSTRRTARAAARECAQVWRTVCRCYP